MTLEQFLAALEKTPRDWRRYRGKSLLRRGKGKNAGICECPVSSLCSRYAADYHAAADELGLSWQLAEEIAGAADEWPDHDPRLRAKLLKATGLA